MPTFTSALAPSRRAPGARRHQVDQPLLGALAAQSRPQPADHEADGGAAEHVRGVVHAEVGPGQADGAGEPVERRARARSNAPHRGRRRQRRGGVGRRERELAGSGGQAGEAAQARAAPAHGELDQIVDPDRGGSDRGGAQPALAAGRVDGGGRDPDRDPNRTPLARHAERLHRVLDLGRVVARAHRAKQAPVEFLEPLEHRAQHRARTSELAAEMRP